MLSFRPTRRHLHHVVGLNPLFSVLCKRASNLRVIFRRECSRRRSIKHPLRPPLELISPPPWLPTGESSDWQRAPLSKLQVTCFLSPPSFVSYLPTLPVYFLKKSEEVVKIFLFRKKSLVTRPFRCNAPKEGSEISILILWPHLPPLTVKVPLWPNVVAGAAQKASRVRPAGGPAGEAEACRPRSPSGSLRGVSNSRG